MKLISKVFFLALLAIATNPAFSAKATLVKFSIANNTLLSWNLMLNADTTNVSPVVERFGGTAVWSASAADGRLNSVGIYYSARGTTTPCLSADRTGIMTINTVAYIPGEVTTIIVNPSETGAPICSCVGSACDVGAARKA